MSSNGFLQKEEQLPISMPSGWLSMIISRNFSTFKNMTKTYKICQFYSNLVIINYSVTSTFVIFLCTFMFYPFKSHPEETTLNLMVLVQVLLLVHSNKQQALVPYIIIMFESLLCITILTTWRETNILCAVQYIAVSNTVILYWLQGITVNLRLL